ncbi:crossover junction endodeoxyribonuclease RuvC [bacterium]
MKILGLDPGTATTGWAIIECNEKNIVPIAYNHIQTSANLSFSDRLEQIYNELAEIINTYKPDVAAVEQLFFAKNVKTAVSVGHARGVMLLTIKQAGIKSFEYTPLQVKQAIVGYGKAEKIQVQIMVKNILKLKSIPKPDDTADALAIALCHKQREKWNRLQVAVTESATRKHITI